VLGKEYPLQECALARTLEVLGERWTLLIVRDALYGVQRFNDFQVHLDIPKAVLADRLNGLVEEGVIDRRPDPEHGGRQLYELTAAGRELWPIVHAMVTCGDRHRERNTRVFRHAACGSRLDDRAACAACGVVPPPEEVIMERRRGRGTTREDRVSMALRSPHRLLDPVETAV
jgi:DNA-binding HxlR family transcriptional regulator